MPACSRHFLGWEAPCPRLAAAWLLDQADAAEGGRSDHQTQADTQEAPLREADLSRWLVVTPTARSARLLLGELVDAAEDRGVALSPPRMMTPAEVPAALLDVPEEQASPALRVAAWMQALQSLAPEDLGALLRYPPKGDQVVGWQRLAELIINAHDELARHRRTFAEARDASEDDPQRWHAADAACARARTLLAEWGRVDGLSAEAEALASARWRDLTQTRCVALVGVTDAPPSVRACLCEAPVELVALVGAPASRAPDCDELGMVREGAWAAPDLTDAHVVFADDPGHGAEEAFAALGELTQPVVTPEACFVVPDPSLASALELKADELAGVRVRTAPGAPAIRSSTGMLLQALSAFLEAGTVSAALDLVRHPDAELALRRTDAAGPAPAAPSALNLARAISAGLPDGVTRWLGADPAQPDTVPSAALDALRRDLVTLTERGVDPANGVRWVREALHFVSGPADSPGEGLPHAARDDLAAAALQRALATLDDLDLASPLPARTVLSLVLADLARTPIPGPHDPGAIEVVGWLELAFDPASAVVVLGVNEGMLPEAPSEHPLLSASARRALGMDESSVRAARDAFLLTGAEACRPHLRLIVLRRDEAGDPLHPSRLLMGGDSATVAARALRAARPELDAPRRRIGRAEPAAPRPAERAEPPEPLRVMGVTWFREYLQCPRLFYLRRVRRLMEGEPAARTLDGGGFGTLIHEVAACLANSDLRAEANPEVVVRALTAELDRLVSQRLAGPPGGLLGVQLDLARRHLETLARVHASRAEAGWRIVRAEWSPARDELWMVDDEPIVLKGRIDRVEQHPSGAVSIIDYKTTRDAEGPDKTHRSKRGWIDLQLPMYRHLARALLDELQAGPVELAYITMPDDPGVEPFMPAPWSEDDLRGADDAAREVVRRVRRGEFDDAANPPRDGTFGIILQTDDLTPERDESDEPGLETEP